MAAGARDIRRAKELLQSKGLLSDISARELVQASAELGKTLVETLDYIRQVVAWQGQ